jgi:hypothetical protein
VKAVSPVSYSSLAYPPFSLAITHRAHPRLLEALSKPRRAILDVIRRALEAAGVDFIDENSGGPGVRLRKPHTSKKRN